MEVEEQIQEPDQQTDSGDPLKDLYDGLSAKRLYTKSFDDFKAKYSTPDAVDKLFQGLADRKLYTNSRDDFYKKYFPDQSSQNAPPVRQNGPYTPDFDKIGQQIAQSITPEKREEMLTRGKAAVEKYGQDYDQAQQNIKIAMTGNDDIIPKVIQHQRQQSNFQSATIPGTDQPLTESAKNALSLLSPTQEQPVTDEDIKGYMQSVDNDPAAARAHINNIMKYKPDQAKDLQTSMYINDAANRYINGGRTDQIEENIKGLKDGSLSYNINSGRIIKPENAIQSIFTGVQNKMRAFDDYHFIENASPQERIKWMEDKAKNINPDEPIPMPEGVLAQATYGIASQPFAGLAGGKLAGMGVAAIPGAEEFAPVADKAVSAWLTGTDFGKMAEAHAYQQTYSQLKHDNPQMSDEDIDQKAMEQAKQEGITEAISGSAMMLLGGKIGEIELPKISLQEGFKAAAATALRNIAKTGAEAGTIGMISAGAKDLEDKLAREKGIFRSGNGDDIREAALQGGLLTAGIIGFTKGAGLVGDITKQKLLQGFSQIPSEKLNEAIGEQVVNKTITPEEAKTLTDAVEEHRTLDKSIPEDITDESRLKIQRKITKRQGLEDDLKTTDEAYHPAIKEQIKGINEDILELSKDKKPKEEKVSQDVPRSTIPEEGQNTIDNKGDVTDQPEAMRIKPESDLIKPTADFRTWDLGDMEGKPEDEAAKKHIEGVVRDWDANPASDATEPTKQGETFGQFVQRVIPPFEKILKEEPLNSTIITHSSVLKAFKVWDDMGRPDVSNLSDEQKKTFAGKYNQSETQNGDLDTFKGDQGDIHVIRHGQTEDNAKNNFRSGDTNLTEKGVKQAHEVAAELKDKTGGDVPKIISSDLPRAIHTSNIITEQLKPTDNASTIRGDQGQIPATGNANEGGQNTGGENIQPSQKPASINGETQQQAGQKEVDKMYGLPFYDEPADKKTGIKNAISNKERFERALPKVDVRSLGGDNEVLNEGKELVDSGKINPRDIVNRILDTNDGMQPDEAKAMQYYMHQLAAHEENLRQGITTAENDFEKSELSGQLQQLSDEMDRATDANIKAGKAWSDVGNIRQIIVDPGFNPSRERAVIKDGYGGEIPKDVVKRLEDITKERDKAIEEKNKLEEQIKNAAAQKTIDGVKKTKTQQKKEDILSERKHILEELKSAIKKDTSAGYAFPFPVHTIEAIGKLAINYVKEGYVNLEEITGKIYDDIKDLFPGATKKDVRDAIAQYGPLKTEAYMRETTKLEKKGESLEKKKGELPKSTQKMFFEKDSRWVKAQQRVVNAQYKIKVEKRKAFESQKNWYQKGLMWLGRGVRISILSGVNVLEKLAAAATIGGLIKRVPEQVIGKMWGTILPAIDKKAPVEGGINIAAEIKFAKDFFNPVKFAHNSWEILKTGASDLSKKHGNAEYEHIPVLYLPTDLHQIIKDPLKRGTYEASLKNVMNWAEKKGMDTNDPLVKQSMETAAYKRANYEIFQEQNWLTKKFSEWKSSMEKKGNTGATGKFLADFMIPVSTVPTNIARRVLTTSPLGLIRGAAKVTEAYRKGIENLSNDEADSIMKQLKQGTLGTALWLTGWFGYKNFGGLYSQFNPNKKRSGDELKSDQMSVNGEMIDKPVQHALPLEIIQLAATMHHIYDHSVDHGEGGFTAALNAGLGSIGAVAEQIPIIETGAHLVGATQDPYEAKKLGEDVQRRFEPQILKETGVIGDSKKQPQTSTTIKQWQP